MRLKEERENARLQEEMSSILEKEDEAVKARNLLKKQADKNELDLSTVSREKSAIRKKQMELEERKRKRRREDHPYEHQAAKAQRKERREDEGMRLAIIGDSLVKETANCPGIAATAWKYNWKIDFKGGASIQDAKSMVDKINLREVDSLILVAGSNNLANAQECNSATAEAQAIATVASVTKEIVRKCSEEGVKILVAMPPHRKDVRNDYKVKAARAIGQAVTQAGGFAFFMEEEKGGLVNREHYLSRLSNRLHFKTPHWREVLQQMMITLEMDVQLHPYDSTFTLEQMFEGVCTTCGEMDHGRRPHTPFSPCERCGNKNHATSVCSRNVMLCKGCGHRGHWKEECPKYRQNYSERKSGYNRR